MSLTSAVATAESGRGESNTAGKHLGLALAVISAAQLMIVLDATIVNVALPTIQKSLHFSTANLEWLITAYAVTFGGLLLFGGRTGDLYGKRRMFMIGVAFFAAASLLGGLATSQAWLIVTRGLQGMGAAIAAPTALSLIATNFPEGQARNRALGVYAAMSGGGGAVGLLLGGILTEWVSWRWIFFVNVPIALAVVFLAPRALNESSTTAGHLDVPGAASVTAGMVSLVFGLSNAAVHGWTSPLTLGPIALAPILLAAFGLIEARTAKPLLPLRIFANRNRSGSYLMMVCAATSAFSMLFFLTQFMQNVLGWSPVKTGIGFVPFTAGVVTAAAVTSRVLGRITVRIPLLVGPSAVFVGLAWMSRLTVTSGYLDILGPLVVMSLGMGMQFVSLTLTAVRGVAPTETGLASALLNTGQQLGGALGLSVLATVAIDATTTKARSLTAAAHGHATGLTHLIAIGHGYTTAFEVAAGIALVGLAISVTVIRFPRPPASSEPALAGVAAAAA
jgi:EmrB/QacA subfamily drug resistance transporter